MNYASSLALKRAKQAEAKASSSQGPTVNSVSVLNAIANFTAAQVITAQAELTIAFTSATAGAACFGTIADKPVEFYQTDTKRLSITSALVTSTLPVVATQFRLSALNTAPTAADDTGTPFEIRFTADYIYFCIAQDTWVRAAIATWGE